MRRIAWTLGAMAALTACLTNGCSSAEPVGSARISLAMRSTSTNSADSATATTPDGVVSRAVVTIDRVYLQSGDGGDVAPPGADDHTDSGRIVLRDQPIAADLLSLSQTTGQLVEEATVPAGRYSQLRFVISGGFIEIAHVGIYATPGYPVVPTDARVVGTLQMPSYAQSGLKVNLPGGTLVLDSGLHRLLRVDFDVTQSFGHVAGASSDWVMHPVVRAADVTATANVVVDLDTSTLMAPPPSPIRAELRAESGVDAMNIALAKGTDAHYSGIFEFLEPSQSPFQLSLFSGTAALNTNPANPLSVSLVSGETKTVEFTAAAGK